ncbi:glycoside hydrolase family 3 protein [Pedobacter glucosidilyticus]|uniref:glycoside hydrolase family 3 protein n=1 Tax=Pedobacter glucosidilyticus TaxID=1122941 RepID=UPI0026F11996|nr:glycoside hydrolase family 3 protein [Pedobacter glucosidilyticus]
MQSKKYLIILSFLTFSILSHAQTYKFQDDRLSAEERSENLVSLLSLEEKVGQMLNAAPAIPRLGIPAYDWWNEVLHGVARTPYYTTVFPQAIAMAATFNPDALNKMADYAALEGRAIYNDAIKTGKSGQRYVGLTYWTPNINIFRDPRWGRGQETYGEDPYLTGTLGKAFVKGLQGDDPKYLKAAACAKHYAVHSGPEPSRHVFNVSPTMYDLWDTYLPAFKDLVVDAKVAGVMCAYNAFKGQPCCASDDLMTDILRNQWQFKGYVTSDCWAIDDFYKNHKTHPDAASAAADAVIHGTDIDCGTAAYKALVDAVKQGKISEKQIDISVQRLFTIRFRLGMFDDVAKVKYAQTPKSVLESQAHQAHALKMARESMVLLKNQNQILPLSKNLKKIVVLGPNADNTIAVLGNYNGIPSTTITALKGIQDKVGAQTQVVYEQAVNFTNDTLLRYINLDNYFSFEGKQGFKAEYFDNQNLSGLPIFVRNEKSIQNFWQEGQIVVNNLKAYNFSARYTADYKAHETGEITFELEGDDGYKFFINGKEVLNAWTRNRWGAKTFKLAIEKDKVYRLVVEYQQTEGKASIQLRTGTRYKQDFDALAKKHQDADAFIFVGGISPQLEGEEMPVNYPGFNGGDRTSILLPQVQTDLMKALKKTQKPIVFVMMTGSAIATPWEAAHVPAIINAWYAGQSAGTAIADVIFGDYNPSGKLPLTFYASDKDLPDFEDYNMANRTYKYFKGKALFPFGYGLSYTNFNYTWDNKPSQNVYKENEIINTAVNIKNIGNKDGDEVLQVYIKYPQSDKLLPLKELRYYKRLSINQKQSANTKINIPINDLKKWDDTKQALTLVSGKYGLFIGSHSEDAKLNFEFFVQN